MKIQDIFNDHYLERIGYFRTSWSPVYYVFVAANARGTPNHRWLVQRPVNGTWVNYYLTPEEAAADDWDWIADDLMKNYQLAQGDTREEPEEVGAGEL